jgi:hypothetical protein
MPVPTLLSDSSRPASVLDGAGLGVDSRRLDIAQRAGVLEFDLFGAEQANDPCGDTRDERPRGDDLPRAHDSPRCNQGILTDFSPIENDRTDADQGAVTDTAAVHHGSVANGDLVSQDRGVAIGRHMKSGLILDVGALTDLDALDIPAQHRPEENTRVLTDFDIPDHHRTRRHPDRIVQPWSSRSKRAENRTRAPVDQATRLRIRS